MEWSADYFNQVKPGDVTYSFNPQRRASKYSTNDFFDGVTYTIDLRQPVGSRITDLRLNDGTPVTDTTPIHLGMNSYRMGHLTQKGGVLEGQTFPVLSDSKVQYGEEAGTIRNLTIRYLTDVKAGKYEGKLQQRWHLVGLEGYEKERQIVKQLINNGTLALPATADGRYTNIASINVKDKIFNDKANYQATLATLQQQTTAASSELAKQQAQTDIALITALNKF
ncbi:bifunctional metallophosphatase/5'-nucleotidase, partial [Yersinia enterocolitica]|nr:bifunctional metallophosphatase/5'-nucleotidase [Yersinia enterocolitica]